eukprot:8510278-Alexandrium_andersonii.AAC.1
MSASLVGSEMCIRDSHRRLFWRECEIASGVRNWNCTAPRNPKFHPGRSHPGGSASLCALTPVCLLRW